MKHAIDGGRLLKPGPPSPKTDLVRCGLDGLSAAVRRRDSRLAYNGILRTRFPLAVPCPLLHPLKPPQRRSHAHQFGLRRIS